MMIDRRTFIAGAMVAAVAPATDLLAWPLVPSADGTGGVVFLVQGWSDQSCDESADQIWLRIDRGWRASWR